MMMDLLAHRGQAEAIAPGAFLLRGFARALEHMLLDAIAGVGLVAPFRHMATPGGRRMSVAMTSCGGFGWTSGPRGYRYSATDPLSGQPWPAMPAVFHRLAGDAAAAAGYPGFHPDSCLVNRYAPGARMSLHQDRDESDLSAPIVSVSLGVAVVFLWGGASRSERARRLPLAHGDVLVWGGASRLFHHGVAPLPREAHPLTGATRFNLTFRRACG